MVDQAAKFLGIGRVKLYEMMNRGELRYAKIGRRRVVPKRALVEVLAAAMNS